MNREFVVSFMLLGEPVSKERPRVGRGRKAYTPQKTQNAEKLLAWACRRARPIPALHEPGYKYLVLMGFYLAGSNAKDIDNMQKTVLDALNRIVWDDDKNVAEVIAVRHHDKTQKPHTKVTIYRVKEEEWKKSAQTQYENWSQIIAGESSDMTTP